MSELKKWKVYFINESIVCCLLSDAFVRFALFLIVQNDCMENKEPIIPPKEHVYLEGPKSRTYELKFAWRVFNQFIKGFRTFHFVGPCISVFGSARFKEDH